MPASKRKLDNTADLPPPSICLPLQKFSQATVHSNSSGPLPWVHLVSQGDIFAVFETKRTLNSDGSTKDTRRFKIVQDPSTKEDLDLDILADESRRAIDTARDASEHSRDHNVAVIKKVPVIAVKYPIYGGQVKRFQIRFTTDADFYEALKQLSNAGVRMLEAGTFPSNRPQTAQQNQVPSVIALPPRPITAGDGAIANLSALNVGPPGPPAGLMPPPPLPSHFTNPPRMYGQADSATSQQLVSTHGSEAMYRSHIDAAHEGVLESHVTPNYTLGNPSVSNLLGRPATIDTYTPRPSTAPGKVSQHLSQVLPPKRELPFKRNGAKGPPLVEVAPVSDEEEPVEHSAPDSLTRHDETIVPDSQTSTNAKRPKLSNKAAVSKKKTTKVPSKPAKGKSAAQTRAQKCDACKRKGGRTRCTHKKASTPVPSIEEVFNRGEIGPPTEMKEKALDTQVLLDRAASARKAATSKPRGSARNHSVPPVEARITRSMSVAARSEIAGKQLPNSNEESVKLEARMRPTIQRHAEPCTPADQRIDPRTPATPVAAGSVGIPADGLESQMRHLPTTSATRPEAKERKGLPDYGDGNFTESPPFAGAGQKLAAFSANLQPEDRQMTLEQWCIQMYRNEDFKVLCRVLDESLKAQLTLPQ